MREHAQRPPQTSAALIADTVRLLASGARQLSASRNSSRPRGPGSRVGRSKSATFDQFPSPTTCKPRAEPCGSEQPPAPSPPRYGGREPDSVRGESPHGAPLVKDRHAHHNLLNPHLRKDVFGDLRV